MVSEARCATKPHAFDRAEHLRRVREREAEIVSADYHAKLAAGGMVADLGEEARP